MGLFKLPECKGYGGIDCNGESDFECRYPRQDCYKYDSFIEDCDACLCSWDTFGGHINPRTNQKWPFFLCFLLFGFPFRHQPCCGNCKYVQDKLRDDGRFEAAKCPITDRCIEPDNWIGCKFFEGKWEKSNSRFK